MVGGHGAAQADFLRRGVPPGSLRHLALLFSGAAARSLPEAVYAIEAELRRIVASASHEAAHARLQWWRDEIDRCAAGRPSHPLAKALLPLRELPGVDLGLLREMLVGAEYDLAQVTYLTWEELDAYLFRSAGTVQTLVAATLAADRGLYPEERDFARRLGAAVRQAEILFDLDRDLAGGRLYAPLQALESAGIDPQALTRGNDGDAPRAFLAAWRDRVRRELMDLPSALASMDQRSRQRHGLVLAALHASWLDRWRAHAGRSDSRGDIRPLARLWIAWRAAVRAT